MSEYIKKSDAREAVRETCRNLNYITPPVMQLTTAIDNAPSADVVEVKHGHWIFHKPFDNGRKNCNECIECSQCHTWLGYDCYAKTPYCPNCGARMDGEVREHE